ncbi:MAG: NADH-quinone oxidoreductase subunit NuoE [Actinobacteria bacterium]|nr:NADH-quinone oxidoreductase subunit NuoE [Actinomycetota bacterium]
MEKSTSFKDIVNEILMKHSKERGALIPILQEIQDKIGYLPPESMFLSAEYLNIPPSQVYGVATFYTQFYLTRQGRHKIKICQGTACHVRGASKIIDAVIKKIGIRPGETTHEFEFSVERVACFGSCALAPVVVIDGKVHGRMTQQKVEKIIGELD